MTRNAIIVGGGPAGISAAIYLQRVGLDPLLIERSRLGGLLLNADVVENYPGFPNGISGEHLTRLFKRQLDKWGVEVVRASVHRILPMNHGFILRTSNGEVTSRCVILATGTKPVRAGVIGEEKWEGKRLFYEVKELPRRDGKEYGIIGGGDAAFDYAMNLSRDGGRIHVIYRSAQPKCISLLLERVRAKENIVLHPETKPEVLKEVDGCPKLVCRGAGGKREFVFDYLLVACGREPNHVEVMGLGQVSDFRFPGLYLAGDVRQGNHRQVSIAVGDGVKAAMACVDYLSGGEDE